MLSLKLQVNAYKYRVTLAEQYIHVKSSTYTFITRLNETEPGPTESQHQYTEVVSTFQADPSTRQKVNQ